MAETNAPPSASPETDELVRQLHDLYTARRTLLDDIRRGLGSADRDALLLELCGFRGMQYTEAAAVIGYTREGVARRVRPLLDKLGVAELSPFERLTAEVERPLKDLDVEELKAALKGPARSETKEANREAAKRARAQRAEMNKLLAKLHRPPHSLSWVELAERLGISVPTLQRLRGVM